MFRPVAQRGALPTLLDNAMVGPRSAALAAPAPAVALPLRSGPNVGGGKAMARHLRAFGSAGSAIDSAARQSRMAALRLSHARQINDVSTFHTKGLGKEKIDAYLSGADGQRFFDALQSADPQANASIIYARAVDILGSGSDLPRRERADGPLFKLVPSGAAVSPFSPFFASEAQIKKGKQSDLPLADFFGLPMKSEAANYDVHQILPTTITSVFVNRVAPTEELNGLVKRAGGALQSLVLNRNDWSKPELVDTIKN
ncbi:hypothetical protein AAKU55_003606 [Oxalobacteraceae bacterium GrIS 1.11]